MKFTSRKFLSMVIAIVLLFVNEVLENPLSEENITMIVGVVATYMVSQGIADHGNQGKKPDIVIAEGEEAGPNWGDTSDIDDDDKKEILG
jgi:hypothetical protein